LHDARVNPTMEHGERAEVLVARHHHASLFRGQPQNFLVSGIPRLISHRDNVVSPHSQRLHDLLGDTGVHEQSHGTQEGATSGSRCSLPTDRAA
jgi:hypothetical protein